MKELIVKAQARLDLRSIAEFIARDNPARAVSFIDELLDRMTAAAEWPKGFRERGEWGTEIRSVSHHRYHIVFREAEHAVIILRVLHGSQDIPTILEE